MSSSIDDTYPPSAINSKSTRLPLAELQVIEWAKLLDRDPEELKKLLRACEDDGFFLLDLKSAAPGTILGNLESLSAVMRDWFSQAVETKLKTETISESHGFKPAGMHAGVANTRDGWEALRVGRSELLGRWALPDVVREKFDTFSEFQSQCHFVTRVLLDCISASLGLRSGDSLHQYHREDAPSKSSLIFLHYPPLDEGSSSGKKGQNMHTDMGSLTLLFAHQWGLQILRPTTDGMVDQETGEALQWASVAPKSGHAIINVGDALRFLSGCRLRSALHRVLPLDTGDRYSVAYFLRPSNDAELVDSKGDTVSALDWYLKKNHVYQKPGQNQDESVLVGGMKAQLL